MSQLLSMLPYLLVAFGAVGLLFYKLQPRRFSVPEIEVSWIEIFDVQEEMEKKKILSKVLLALQLMVLAGFLLVLFEMPLVGEQKTAVLVLDRSLSMLSRDKSSDETRFEQAKARLIEELKKLGDARGRIYTFGGAASPKDFANVNEAIKMLEEYNVSHSGGTLEELMQTMVADIKARRPDLVVVTSDHYERWTELAKLPVPVRYHVVGGGTKNVFVGRLRTHAGFLNLHQQNIHFSYSVGNASEKSCTVEQWFEVDDKKTRKRRLTFNRKSTREEVIRLDELMADARISRPPYGLPVKLVIRPEKPCRDDLPEDNQAWEMIPDNGTINLGVYDKKLFRFLDREFKLTPSPHIRKIKVIDLSSKEKRARSSSTAHIAVRNASPPSRGEPLPDHASLYILAHPPKKNARKPDIKSNRRIERLKKNCWDESGKLRYGPVDVMTWHRDNELMAYLENFSVARMEVSLYPFHWILQTVQYDIHSTSFLQRNISVEHFSPDWLETVMYGRLPLNHPILRGFRVPIVLQGTYHDNSTVIFNFDITNPKLAGVTDIKILLINAIGQLYRKNRMTTSVAPGERIGMIWPAESGPFEIEKVGGEVKIQFTEQVSPPLDISGEYVLRSLGKGQQRIHRFAVRGTPNVQEHRLIVLATRGLKPKVNGVTASRGPGGESDAPQPVRDWFALLLAVLLGVIFVEGLLFLFAQRTGVKVW